MKEDTYYSKNKDRLLQRSKEYREENKEYYNLYYKQWYAENKDLINAKRNEQRRLKPKVIREKRITVRKIQETGPVIIPVFQDVEPVIVREPVDPERFTVKFE